MVLYFRKRITSKFRWFVEKALRLYLYVHAIEIRSQTVPEEIYSSIISRVHKTWPSIGVLVDRRYSFGFRPYRHGGVNLKGRKIEVNDEAGSVRSVIIIDHYGHGGGGKFNRQVFFLLYLIELFPF
jgi:hypothetical protein